MLVDKRLALLGLGKLGETMVRALLDAGVVDRERLVATAKHQSTLDQKADIGIRLTTDNRAAAEGADVVIVSVKPQGMVEVLDEIRPVMRPGQLVLSTAASVTTAEIEAGLRMEISVVRAMPNTPCLVRCGMTALCAGRHAGPEDLALAREIFNCMGRSLVLDERHMNAVTGLSGSGPAYMYVVLEALAEGGLKVGLPRETATELIAQTMLGAAEMVLQTGEHPAKLKDAVITPAGCTIDGLLELEDGGLRVALIKAVVRATQRVGELSQPIVPRR